MSTPAPLTEYSVARAPLFMLGIALSFGGCSFSCNPDRPAAPGIDAGQTFDSGPCGSTRMLCEGACIDPLTDPAYCGAFGICLGTARGSLCETSELCVDGECRPPCGPRELRCGGDCIDPLTDRDFCGAEDDCELNRGEPCAPAQDCVGGLCEGNTDCDEDGSCPTSCPRDFIECEGSCIDPRNDDGYCGAEGDCLEGRRGEACGADRSCVDGGCQRNCPPDFIDCDGRCIDPARDPQHCGASGNCLDARAGAVCLPGQACSGGICLWQCPVGLLACDGDCIDPVTDALHCGASSECSGSTGGRICAADEACVGGLCLLRCDPAELICDEVCTDPLTDPRHCGASGQCEGADAGQVCGLLAVCNLGTCARSCTSPLVVCDGGCVALDDDRDHCGRCGAECQPGERCKDAACVLGCPLDQVSCDDRCIDPITDFNFCGATDPCVGSARGEACSVGQACLDGSCEAACPTGFLRCDGACTELTTDPNHCGECDIACGGTEACDEGECMCEAPPDCECVVHVNQRTGDDSYSGDSWSFPLATVGAGIDKGRARGCAIWVAAGTYLPTADNARSASFTLQRGVFLFGGFAGGETNFGQRDIANNPTVLSGDIGAPGDSSDNSFHVVTCLAEAGCDDTAMLDGFIVRGGQADGGQDGGEGGGMRISGAGPTLANCRFEYNQAFRGGALFVYDGKPSIVDSVFADNGADTGGAIHAIASAVEIHGCRFERHVADDGGGSIYANNNTRLVLSDSDIVDSETAGDGGAILNIDGTTELRDSELLRNSAARRGGAVSAGGIGDYLRTTMSDNRSGGWAAALDARGQTTVTDCTFERNVSDDDAGAIYAQLDATIAIVGSTLRGNRAFGYGGALWTTGAEVQLMNNLFEDNESTVSGGGAQISRSHLIASGNRFIDNRTVYNGGGLHSSDPASEAQISDEYFRGNFSDRGGGLKLSQGWAHVHRCLFEQNTADHGAGLATFQLEATIHDCVFRGNIAVTYGGGMSGYYNSVLDITHCTFYGNVLTGPDVVGGAGLHSFVSTQLRVRNCVLWGNRAPSGSLSEQQVFTPEVRAVVTYSDVESGCAVPGCTTDATGNIASPPLFVDGDGGDFRLLQASQCIDAGINAAIDWPQRLDHGGLPRVTDGPDGDNIATPDMGAHEWQP